MVKTRKELGAIHGVFRWCIFHELRGEWSRYRQALICIFWIIKAHGPSVLEDRDGV